MAAKKTLPVLKKNPKQKNGKTSVAFGLARTERQPIAVHEIEPEAVSAPQEELMQLREEVQGLRRENNLLKNNLVALLHEDIPVNKRLLKLAAKEPSIVDLIAEVKRAGA